MIAPLPTHLADPAERLRAAHEAMRVAKEQHNALPAELLTDIAQFSMPALANRASRLASRLRLLERIWSLPFRRDLAEVPLGLDQPYWIEDPDFDIEFHVRELALPAPGDDRQLAIQGPPAPRRAARPRRRPLGSCT